MYSVSFLELLVFLKSIIRHYFVLFYEEILGDKA